MPLLELLERYVSVLRLTLHHTVHVSSVANQVALPVKRLPTQRTLKWLFPGVYSHVADEVRRPCQTDPADRADMVTPHRGRCLLLSLSLSLRRRHASAASPTSFGFPASQSLAKDSEGLRC